jgi:hypothetical protein
MVDLEIESQPLAADQTVHDGRRHARPPPTLLMFDEAGRVQQSAGRGGRYNVRMRTER